MTPLNELIARQLRKVEELLLFKEAALRYCNHTKKRDKLFREVQDLKEVAVAYREMLKEEAE